MASHGAPQGNPALRHAEQGALPSGSGWPPVKARPPPHPCHVPPRGFPHVPGTQKPRDLCAHALPSTSARQPVILHIWIKPPAPSLVLRHLPTLHRVSRSAAPRQGSGQVVGGRAGVGNHGFPGQRGLLRTWLCHLLSVLPGKSLYLWEPQLPDGYAWLTV